MHRRFAQKNGPAMRGLLKETSLTVKRGGEFKYAWLMRRFLFSRRLPAILSWREMARGLQ